MIASIIFLCYTLIVSRKRDQENDSLNILYGGLYVSKQTR